MGHGTVKKNNKQLSDADLAFLRAPENRGFAETLNINSNYLFPASGSEAGKSGIDNQEREAIKSAIIGQRALVEGRKYFAPREAQAANPLVLQALQQSMAQQPMLAGFETQMAQLPQFQQGQVNLPSSALNPYSAPQQFAGGPQIGGMQGGLLGSLSTKGQQQIAAGQAMNPTILKAKSV